MASTGLIVALAGRGGAVDGAVAVGAVDLAASSDTARAFAVPLTGDAGTSGMATVMVNPARSRITVMLTHLVPGATAAEIRLGATAVGARPDRGRADDGPLVFELANGSVPTPLLVTLTAADVVAQPAAGVRTFDDAVARLVAGETALIVRSTAFPSATVRGPVR